MHWHHAKIPFRNLFSEKKDAYHQFLKDFPRQTMMVHGNHVPTISQFIELMHNHVHPSLHVPIITVSTQASMAYTYELLQSKQHEMISGSTQGLLNDRLVFHYVIVTPYHVKVILEKNFGIMDLNGDAPRVTSVIHSFTMLEIKPHWISDFYVSWKK